VSGIDAYLERLASAEPTPGGGSAATVVGALGAALCAMVARITAGSERLRAVRGEAEALAAAADALRERFGAARPLDEAAYERVVRASALPKGDEAAKRARGSALQAALAGAAEAPLAAAGLAAEGFGLAERAAGLGNAHLASDVECALLFFRAALEASVANVRINHRFIKDGELVAAQGARLIAIAREAGEREARARTALG
jgi:formiminotetrahydrofolate cyclodeaminase